MDSLTPDGVKSGMSDRIETGSVAFGTDWPGVFIRGDDAFAYSLSLEVAEERLRELALRDETTLETMIAWQAIGELRKLLRSCDVRDPGPIQQLKPASECLHLLQCRISIKGSTQYCVVWAPTVEQALQMGAGVLGKAVEDLECDVESGDSCPESR